MSRLQEDLNKYTLGFSTIKINSSKVENNVKFTQCKVYEYAKHTKDKIQIHIGGYNKKTFTNVASYSVQENNYWSVKNDIEKVNLQVKQREVKHGNNEREILHGVLDGKDQASDDINQKEIPESESNNLRRIYWATKKPKLADIVKSRQTDYPFILDILKFDKHFKCFGCQDVIKPMDVFLNHREEYPANSGNIVGQSYHVDINCLHRRGFTSEYISKIKVMLRVKYNTTHDDLMKIGFQVIEDYNKETYDNHGNDDALSVTSECSLFSNEANPEGSNIFAMRNSRLYFQFRLLHVDHDEPMSCYSCEKLVTPGDYYLSTKEFDIITTFHVNKKCLLAKGQVTLNDLKNACCYMMKDYNSENIQKLIKCGFISQNIRRYINRNGNQAKPQPVRNSPPKIFRKNAFLFNFEPFKMVFYLLKDVICSGCKKSIVANNKPHFLQCLLHKEVIPSDIITEECLPGNNAEELPTSQYYHANWNCLHDRGFTNAYLEVALCKMEKFHQVPNRFQTNIKKLLQRCGFKEGHIDFSSDTNAAVQTGLDWANSTTSATAYPTLPEGVTNFIHILKFHSSKELSVTNQCFTCKLGLFDNSICIMHVLNQGNHNERKEIYHLNCFKSTCRNLVNVHNIPYQIDSDVPEGVLIHCGIEDDCNLYKRNESPLNFPPSSNRQTMKEKQKVLVQTSHEKKICMGCHIGICRNTYAMYFSTDLKWIHLDTICLKLAHYQLNEIEYRSLSVESQTVLRESGFRL